MRRHRKTKVQPSQVNRRRRHPERRPGEKYRTTSYYYAIRRGVDAANKERACDSCRLREPADRCETCKAASLPYWHPHQLRHSHAAEARRQFGLEAAQVALGHSQANVTEVYAERDLALAMNVAAAIG